MCEFKVGDKVKTLNGMDVEIVCVDGRSDRPVMGVVFWAHGEKTSEAWHGDGSFTKEYPGHVLNLVPKSRTVTLYQALVRNKEGRYFSPEGLFSGLDDDGIEDWNEHGYKVIRLLTEYPVEVEQ